MSNKKQTAVEWLIKKIANRENGIFDGFPHLSLDEIFEQAKAMEKDQIEKTWYECKLSVIDKNTMTGEQYNKETYEQ